MLWITGHAGTASRESPTFSFRPSSPSFMTDLPSSATVAVEQAAPSTSRPKRICDLCRKQGPSDRYGPCQVDLSDERGRCTNCLIKHQACSLAKRVAKKKKKDDSIDGESSEAAPPAKRAKREPASPPRRPVTRNNAKSSVADPVASSSRSPSASPPPAPAPAPPPVPEPEAVWRSPPSIPLMLTVPQAQPNQYIDNRQSFQSDHSFPHFSSNQHSSYPAQQMNRSEGFYASNAYSKPTSMSYSSPQSSRYPPVEIDATANTRLFSNMVSVVQDVHYQRTNRRELPYLPPICDMNELCIRREDAAIATRTTFFAMEQAMKDYCNSFLDQQYYDAVVEARLQSRKESGPSLMNTIPNEITPWLSDRWRNVSSARSEHPSTGYVDSGVRER
ncbi:hypothetical protein C8J56DRAFT_384431 [Mycena floridula]|nr:hypothetical protein C8J56DRAFT_384431 [Mycena floridula]